MYLDTYSMYTCMDSNFSVFEKGINETFLQIETKGLA